jgi:hypothetical protein
VMRWVLLVSLAGLALSACGSAAVASHELPSDHGWVLSCSKQRLSEPSFLVLNCKNSSPLLADATWTSWGVHRATGTARLGVAPCHPVCKVAAMDFYPHARVTFLDPRVVDGRPGIFTRVLVTYTFEGKRYSVAQPLLP